MKKLLTLLLTLVMTICLVNINTNITEAKESGGTLYFGKGTGNKWSLWKDEDLTQEYTGNIGKWSAHENKLTLDNGFVYEFEDDGATGIDFTKNDADTELIITGPVHLNLNKGLYAITFKEGKNLTIKGSSGSASEQLKINIGNKNGSGRAIVNGGRLTSITGLGTLKVVDCKIDIDATSFYESIMVYGFEATNAKIVINNKDTGSAIDCVMKDTNAVNKFADENTSMDLKSKEAALRITVDSSIVSTVSNTFNSQYTFEINDNKNNKCNGYLVKAKSLDNIFELYHEKDKTGGIPKSTPYAKLVKVTETKTAKATYDDAAGWSIKDSDGKEMADKRDASNPNGTWDINGDKKDVTLNLYDGFELGSKSAETITFVPTDDEDLNVTVYVEGQADIVSSYSGNEKHTVIKTEKSNNGQKEVKNLNIKGNGNSELNIIAGTSGYEPTDLKESTTTVIDAGDANVKVEDIKLNMSTPDHKSGKRTTGIKTRKLKLKNSKTTIKVGQKPTTVEPGTPPTLTLNLATALGAENQEKVEIVVEDNSELEMIGAATTIFGDENSNVGITGDEYKVEGSYDVENEDPVEEKEIKYDKVNLTSLMATMPVYNTFCAASPTFGGTNVPLQRVVIKNVSIPSPSPSKKDESCEKVIGPTWHWNDSKGICEDYGVVGTSTR